MSEQHKPASKGNYYVIYLVLVGLTFLALAVPFGNFGGIAVVISLLIAATEACIVAYFFMHLKDGDTITWLAVGAGIFWTGLLFMFFLTDYLTRHYAAY